MLNTNQNDPPAKSLDDVIDQVKRLSVEAENKMKDVDKLFVSTASAEILRNMARRSPQQFVKDVPPSSTMIWGIKIEESPICPPNVMIMADARGNILGIIKLEPAE